MNDKFEKENEEIKSIEILESLPIFGTILNKILSFFNFVGFVLGLSLQFWSSLNKQ